MSRRNQDLALEAVLSALTAPPSERELDGIMPALTALRAARVETPSTRHPRRRSMLSILAGAKLGATLAGIAVGLGGAATVVYVSANVATTPAARSTAAASPTQAASGDHATGRPTTGTPTPAGTPVGPDAKGAAAHGLCTAWKAVGTGKAMDAVAFRNLATAAGGEDQIAGWCATRRSARQGERPRDRQGQRPADRQADDDSHGQALHRPRRQALDAAVTARGAGARPAPDRSGDVPGPPTTSHPTGRP